MTQNKFWLVWNEAGNAPKKRHDTEESAYKEAHKLASMYPKHEYFVCPAIRSFKANVNVVETDLIVPEIVTTTPTETLTPKFKVGDKVKYINTDVKLVTGHPIETGTVKEIRDCENGDQRIYVSRQDNFYSFFNKEDLTLAE